MSTIGTLAYQIVADTRRFSEGVAATRAEMRLIRQVMQETRQPVADLVSAEDRLQQMYQRRLLTTDQYRHALGQLRAESPESVAAAAAQAETQARLNREHAEAAAIIARHRTEQDKYAESMQRLAQLKAGGQFEGAAGQAAYRAEVERLKSTLPAVQAKKAAAEEQARAEKAAAAEQQRAEQDASRRKQDEVSRQRAIAQEIVAAQKTPMDRFREAAARVGDARGHLTVDQYAKAVRGLRMDALEAIPILGRLVEGVGRIPGVGGLLRDLVTAGPKAMLAGAGVGMAGAAVGMATSVWHQAPEQISEVNSMAKSGRRLGADPREFIELAEAGEKFGIETTNLEEKLFRLQTKLGDAASGGRSAQASFEQLGLNWRQMTAGSPVEAFLKTAEAIRSTGNASSMASAAQDLFGKGARELLPLLRMSREEFTALAEEHKKAGLIPDNATLALFKAAKAQAKEADEAWKGLVRTVAPVQAEWSIGWNRLKADVFGFAQGAASVMFSRPSAVYEGPKQEPTGPTEAELEKMAGFGQRMEQLRSAADERRKAAVLKNYERPGVDMELVKLQLEQQRLEAEASGNKELEKKAALSRQALQAAMEEAAAVERVTEAHKADQKAAEERRAKAKAIEDENANLARNMQAQIDLWRMTNGHVEQAQHVLSVYQAQLKGLAGEQLAARMAQAQYLDALDTAKRVTAEAATGTDRYREEVRKLTDAFQRGLVNADIFYGGLAKSRKAYLAAAGLNLDEFKTPSEKMAAELKKVDEAGKTLGWSLEQIAAIKDRVADKLRKPFEINSKTVGIEATVGGTLDVALAAEAHRQQLAEDARRANQVPLPDVDKQVAAERRAADLKKAQQAAEREMELQRFRQTAISEEQQAWADAGGENAADEDLGMTIRRRRVADLVPGLQQPAGGAVAQNAGEPADDTGRVLGDAAQRQTELLQGVLDTLRGIARNGGLQLQVEGV